MPNPITRRKALSGLTAGAVTLLGTAGTARADVGFDDSPWAGYPAGRGAAGDDVGAAAVAFAGFRVVRAVPGPPSVPEVTLSAGYTLVPGATHNVASRAEFYAFVTGEADGAGVTVSVRWPGQRIAAVVAGDTRLGSATDPADPERVSFRLPVLRASASADQGTIQVWSHITGAATGEYLKYEHNDPDRAAGPWTTVAWPAGAVRAATTWVLATHEILQDSGLAARARERGHFFALMGFETNNTLHADNPPHWHMSYYPGPTMSAPRQTIPHFWVNGRGQVFYNGQDRQGEGRTRYRLDDPAPIFDAEGALVVTTTIRAHGGLDVDTPDGLRYTVYSPDGDYTGPVQILRDGKLWRWAASDDDVKAGILRTDVRGAGRDPVRESIEYRYDALTGVVLSTKRF
jgi:hypothetical protein